MAEVYYVEDDINIASIVKEYLGQRGYAVSIKSLKGIRTADRLFGRS